MGHDRREDTYAKLIQKCIYNLVGVSIKYKVQNLDLELIKAVEGDDKGKWKHHQHLNFSSSAVQKRRRRRRRSKNKVNFVLFMSPWSSIVSPAVRLAVRHLIHFNRSENACLHDFLFSLSFLSSLHLLPPFFWAAQSRMRVILPMSPLWFRNPTFWQHPDLLTS